MAKKSMVAKAKREPKFSTRQHNRCIALRSARAPTTASSACAAFACASWQAKANCPA